MSMDDQSFLLGLIFECPFKNNCCKLLDHIRTLPVKERVKWMLSLSKEEVKSIVDKHRLCFVKLEDNNDIPLF